MVGALVGSMVAIAQSLRQTTQWPDWYQTQSSPAVQGRLSLEDLGHSSEAVVLGSAEVGQLVQEAIARQSLPDEWAQPAAHLQAVVEEGRLKTGTVINLADLPLDEIDASDRATLEQLLAQVPGLSRQELFIGLETRPQVRDGRLVLDGNTILRLGTLHLPLGLVMQQFGLSLEDLETALTEALRREGIDPEQIQIEGDRIRIQP